jgi:transposase
MGDGDECGQPVGPLPAQGGRILGIPEAELTEGIRVAVQPAPPARAARNGHDPPVRPHQHAESLGRVALGRHRRPRFQLKPEQHQIGVGGTHLPALRQIHELRAHGESISAISRSLHLDIQTVRRFAHASSLEELLAKTAERASVLDGFTTYLHQRWNQGCTDAAALTMEIKALGYAGSDQTVRRYLRPFRHGRPTPPPGPTPPTVREVTGWILRRPDSLDAQEQTRLKEILARCPQLAAASAHVAAFADMLTGRHGDRLDGWIAAVAADGLPGLHSFTTGLRRDHQAVTNGLTLSYSSGAVEGNVNRIKTLKRQMYGRASFDLLRKRVLLVT